MKIGGGVPYGTVSAGDAGPAEDMAGESDPDRHALRQAVLDSPNISIIVTDKSGLIQVFPLGAEIMLGYAAAEIVGKVTPVGLCSPNDLTLRAEAFNLEYSTSIASGFEALVFKASRGVKDISVGVEPCKRLPVANAFSG
jgi:hypothetical protein